MYEDIAEDVERASMYIFGTMFASKEYMREDLLQEARIAIWETMLRQTILISYLPKLAYQAMITALRKRYHLMSQNGYLEEPMPDGVDFNFIDYTLQECLLFHDMENVVNKKAQNPTQYKRLGLALYAGYGFEDIGKMEGLDRGNIHKKARRLGRYLLEGWKVTEC